MGVLWPPLTKNFQHTLTGAEKKRKVPSLAVFFTIPYTEGPKIRWPKYSQNLLDCRPNDASYAFLRPGQILLANFGAAGQIKDIGYGFGSLKSSESE